MGSVIDECKCPNCGFEHATSDFYYKIGIEYIFCQRCGFAVDWEEPNEEHKTWKPEEHGGHGCFHVGIRGIGTLYGLDNEGDAEGLIKEFKQEEHTTKSGEMCDSATVTFLKDGIWMVYDLLTKTKRPFDEYWKERYDIGVDDDGVVEET